MGNVGRAVAADKTAAARDSVIVIPNSGGGIIAIAGPSQLAWCADPVPAVAIRGNAVTPDAVKNPYVFRTAAKRNARAAIHAAD